MAGRAKSEKLKSAVQAKPMEHAPEGRLAHVKSYILEDVKIRDKDKIERDARVSKPTARFDTGEELIGAITKKCDMVALGVELMKDDGDRKNSNIRLRMWWDSFERMYGKAGAAREEDPPRIVLDGLPRPQRNRMEEETL
jgi:hypothetical protein